MVHVRTDHKKRVFCVRSSDAGVCDVEAHGTHCFVQAGGDLRSEIEALELRDFVADSRSRAVVDEQFDMCGETALLVEGKVHASSICAAIYANLVGERRIFADHWRSRARIVIEEKETASAFSRRRKGIVLPAGLSILTRDILAC